MRTEAASSLRWHQCTVSSLAQIGEGSCEFCVLRWGEWWVHRVKIGPPVSSLVFLGILKAIYKSDLWQKLARIYFLRLQLRILIDNGAVTYGGMNIKWTQELWWEDHSEGWKGKWFGQIMSYHEYIMKCIYEDAYFRIVYNTKIGSCWKKFNRKLSFFKIL